MSNRAKLSLAVVLVLVIGGAVCWKALATKKTEEPQAIQFKSLSGGDIKLTGNEQIKMNGQTIELKDGKLSPESEKAMMASAGQHRKEMLDNYFKLAPGKARQDYLDDMIRKQEEARKMMESMEKGGGPTTKPGTFIVKRTAGGSGAAAQKQMAESVSAEDQAQMAQYMKDMNDRRAALGLPPQQGFMMVKFQNK